MLCAVLLFGASASATTKGNLTITQVTYDGWRLILTFAGDNNYYYVFRTSPPTNCPTQSTDTVKLWISMAQAGMLAGKLAEINYTPNSSTGCAVRTIDSITIFR